MPGHGQNGNRFLRVSFDVSAAAYAAFMGRWSQPLAVGFADRTYVLANGELRLTLSPDDADNTELMTAAYFSG
jgi:ABC-type branched-subunit amino acid transport system ATPase component